MNSQTSAFAFSKACTTNTARIFDLHQERARPTSGRSTCSNRTFTTVTTGTSTCTWTSGQPMCHNRVVAQRIQLCERDCLLEGNGKMTSGGTLIKHRNLHSCPTSLLPHPRLVPSLRISPQAPLEQQYAPSHGITKVSQATSICTLVQVCCHAIAGASRCRQRHTVQTVGIAEASESPTTQLDLALDQSHPHTAWCRKSVQSGADQCPRASRKSTHSSWYRRSVPYLFLELKELIGNARKRACPSSSEEVTDVTRSANPSSSVVRSVNAETLTEDVRKRAGVQSLFL